MDIEAQPPRGKPLSDAFAGLPPSRHGRLPNLEAASRTVDAARLAGEAVAGHRSSAGLDALRANRLRMPDVTSTHADLMRQSIANSPAAVTARATREVADRLADYQREVASLVESIKADAAEDRARAERSEAHAKASLRLARLSLAAGTLVGVGGIAAAFLA